MKPAVLSMPGKVAGARAAGELMLVVRIIVHGIELAISRRSNITCFYAQSDNSDEFKHPNSSVGFSGGLGSRQVRCVD